MKKIIVLVVFLCLFLQSCSIHRALSGPPSLEIEKVKIGAPRNKIISVLGLPKLTENKNDVKTDMHEFVYGFPMVSKIRVLLYIAGDVATLGLTELIFWPLEITVGQGIDGRAIVTYGPDDTAKSILLTKQDGSPWFGEEEQYPPSSSMVSKPEGEKIKVTQINHSNAGSVKTGKEWGQNSIPQGKSAVYFYRPANTMTMALSPSIYDNDKIILNGLGNGRYWVYFVDPGKHIFSTSSRTTTGSTLTIENIGTGEGIFIRMDILMKAFAGETKLTKVNPDQGREEIIACNLAK